MTNRIMKRNVYYIATLILTVVVAACGQSKSPSKEQEAAESYDYRVIETAPACLDTLIKDSSEMSARIQRFPYHPRILMMMAIRNSLPFYQKLYKELIS